MMQLNPLVHSLYHVQDQNYSSTMYYAFDMVELWFSAGKSAGMHINKPNFELYI